MFLFLKFYFTGTALNATQLNLQMILVSHLSMKRKNTVFSKVISCCSAVQDPIQVTKGSVLVETTLKDKLHSVKTVYSSNSYDFTVGQKIKWLGEELLTFPALCPVDLLQAEQLLKSRTLYQDGAVYLLKTKLSDFYFFLK